ncbi:trehalase [Loa loa]|uniref:Trehalase n=1 Tax=Loa loa TaxID=7209 RepID=A0A1S0TU56_LOALO|nr:trehalase [Loa loa]EFO20256.2 trehalase [Loa loa]
MQSSAICICAILIVYMLKPLIFFSPFTAHVGVVIKSLEEQKNLSQVCDESDKTGNWFIYCSGNILAAMNLHQLELDSKTFVDRPLKADPKVVRDEFLKKFGGQTVENINSQELLAFRERYFDKEGQELEKCNIPGWQELPPKIARIRDETLKHFAIFLNKRWKDLCRQVKPIKHPQRHSLIVVPESFIVPGGRFREFYYWDAYWIVKGLIASNLYKMVKNMLTNFLHCVKKFGFMPNGGRVYYLRRSQPPFLIPMVYEYYKVTKDTKFIKENFNYLVKEFEFWIKNRSLIVQKYGQNFTVYQYRTVSNVPRPESYRVDVEAAVKVKQEDRQKFFQDLASAAESGWDFSSRWFKDRQTMQSIETTNVVPVDLNALLCWNANILKYLASITGDKKKVAEFESKKESISEALNAVFYNNTEKSWFDYNLRTKSHNVIFYPSNVMPLFTQCYSEIEYEKPADIVNFMDRSNLFGYQNGVPTSLETSSGEKWDFPNGWAPLQHIIIEGMRKSNNPDVQELAYKLAKKWVLANYRVYQATNQMWDKIDIIGTVPKPGSGGEYNVQDGFGWTNGVILDLLATYYDRMSVPKTSQKENSASMFKITPDHIRTL